MIRLAVKFCLSAKIIYQVFCFFFPKKKLKGELPLQYESYAGEIVVVILIKIGNVYCFILY